MFKIDRMDELFLKLKPAIGEKKAKALWLLYHFDRDQKGFIESMAHLMSSQYLDLTFERNEIFLPPIPMEKAEGEYPLGIVCYGEKPLHPFALREGEFIHHVSLFGRSGSD